MVTVASREMRGGGCMHGNKKNKPHGGIGMQDNEGRWLHVWEIREGSRIWIRGGVCMSMD